MVSGKMAGIKQVGHDVQKLTDLMERFHSLSKLYEAKPKGPVRKEKTSVENSRGSPKQEVLDELLHNNKDIIPRPMPPAVQRKGRKLSLPTNRENGKNSGKSSKKQRKESSAKLYSGKEVGVKVYQLKDSESEENVKQSIAMSEDDVKYSFHQPTQISLTSEATLYQEALTSSRKYVNLNSRNHTLNPSLRDSGNGKPNSLFRLPKSNTISDFNFEHRATQKNFEAIQNGYSNGIFAEGNPEIFAKDMPGTIELDGKDYVSKDIGKRSNTLSMTKNAMPRTFLRPLMTATTTVLSNIPEGSTCKNEAEEVFERNLKKATEKITDDDFIIGNNSENITSFLKMPKFVRSNEEIDAAHSHMRNGRILQEQRQNLSATSYYISAHPHVGSLSSVSASDQLGNSPDSRISFGYEPLARPQTPANTPQSKNTPFSSPLNGGTSPLSPKMMDTPKGFPIATLQKEAKSKGADSKKQRRKQLTRNKGKIRKPASLKDPNLETCVEGHSLAQTLNLNGSESPAHEIGNELKDTNGKVRKEKTRSSGSEKKDSGKQNEVNKKTTESSQAVFDVCESFVIRSKQPIQQQVSRSSPHMQEINAAKVSDRHPKKLSPLNKLNTEMRRSKFILARTEKKLNELSQGNVRLVSDPVSFSVRHPSYISSSAHGEDRKSLTKPSRNVLLGKVKETRQSDDEVDDAVVVFYHHENPMHKVPRFQSRSDYHLNANDPILESEEVNPSDSSLMVKSQKKTKHEEDNVKRQVGKNKRKTEIYNPEVSDNMTRQSKIVLTRLEQLQNDRATFLRLMEQEFLKEAELMNHEPMVTKSLCSFVDIKQEIPPPSLSLMWKKFASNEIAQKLKMSSNSHSQYHVKHDGSEEKKVKIENVESQNSKNRKLAFRLNYVLPPSPSRRYTFPFGLPVKPPIKPVKSVSSGSDDSGSKSVSITDLNLRISPSDRLKHCFMPNFGRSVKLEKVEHPSSYEVEPQDDIHSSLVTLPEIERSQFLSSVSQNHSGNDVNSDLYVFIDPK